VTTAEKKVLKIRLGMYSTGDQHTLVITTIAVREFAECHMLAKGTIKVQWWK
jgi:hypothetical protein